MATTNKVKTIGVLTSGGDAPGMNAAIRAAVRRGLQKGVQMKGILKGYDGLMNEEIIDMTARDVSDTIERGGTTLRDFIGGDGQPGYFQQELFVYGRGYEPCKICGTELRDVKLGQRASVFCPRCQT